MSRNVLVIIGLLISSLSLQAQQVILQAEFEKNEGIILKWNYNAAIDSTVARITSVVSADNKVWILFDPDQAFSTSEIQAQLISCGANPANIIFSEGIAENPWLRDYGPMAGYYIDDLSVTIRHFVDAQYDPAQYPQADFLPLQLASDFSFNYEAMPLNFEYGNLMLDGTGRGFVSDRVLTQNPLMNTSQVMQSLYTKLSLNEIIILPSIPECGGGEWSELSRLVKFADPETVLVAQFPESLPFYQSVEAIADTLSRTYNDVGKLLTVIRLPVAPDENGEYSVTTEGAIRSYTSSILFNNKILIPSYNSPTDAVALSIYQQLFQGYEIFQIPSSMLAASHGSLFRLAVNVPQPLLFRLRHPKLTGMQTFENEILINTFVQSITPVDSIQLFYRIHPSTAFQVLNAYGCCGGNNSMISGYSISDTISYYLQAFLGEYTQSLPLGVPASSFTFWFDPYTGIQSDIAEQQVIVFPNPVSEYIFIKGLSDRGDETTYQLLNLNGVIVAEGKAPFNAGIKTPDYLVNGLYFIKIITSGKTHISKLYLQR